ncbi:hypothetical protein L0Y40_01430 [Candidatus Wolfebacteria bacterium]|nr:hypothetical protein [Candidatus Wolfebacteria bacterium]
MNFLKQHKTAITILVLVILIFVAYGVFSGSGDEDVLVSEDAAAPTVGGDLIVLLGRLQSLSLDSTVFSNPIFRNLVDFGVELVPEPVGRSNPFAPIGA